MKSYRTLLFILAVFALFGIAWWLFPAEGIKIGNMNLRFPSYVQAQAGEQEDVDVDAVLESVNESFEMKQSESLKDSLCFFRDYLTENPNRIYLPGDDYEYFDSIFALFESARENGKIYRIMHYGDSQIEMDRISSVFRQKLQELFGGSGPNMIPAIQTVPTISVSQRASGVSRYAIIGDSTSHKASHNRYGVMTQFGQINGEGSISFSQSNHSQALDNVKQMSKVSVLLGHNSQGFTASLKCDTISTEPKVLDANDSVSLVTWDLPANVRKGTITMRGNAEIYGVLLDGNPGVALDNVPLRGCSGTIFTRINQQLLKQSYDLLDTKMIILQFGGNRMPGITTSKSIAAYMQELEKQIGYVKSAAPNATFLFIGPADMGKKYNGVMCTWKGLPELNDSLRAMALRNGVAYWDMFHVMGGEGSMAQWVKHSPALAGPDYVHFTFTGAQEIGADLAKSFTTYYDFYKLRQRVPHKIVSEYVKREADNLPPALRYQIPTYQPFKKVKQ